jgi:hypothetical protein
MARRKRATVLLILGLTLFLCAAIMAGRFACTLNGCTESFGSQRALTAHCRTEYQGQNVAASASRTAMKIASGTAEPPAKRPQTAPSTPEVGHVALPEALEWTVSMQNLAQSTVANCELLCNAGHNSASIAQHPVPGAYHSCAYHRMPAQYCNKLPPVSLGLDHTDSVLSLAGQLETEPFSDAAHLTSSSLPADLENNDEWLVTDVDNSTGLCQHYPHAPTCNPDRIVSLSSVCDTPELAPPDTWPQTWWAGMTCSLAGFAPTDLFAPLANITQFWFMDWHYNCNKGKSNADTNTMIQEVIGAPNHSREDALAFSIENLDCAERFAVEDSWHKASLEIPVPHTLQKIAEAAAPHFSVPGFVYRQILPVLVSFFQNAPRYLLHYTLYQLWQCLPDGTFEQVFTEFYNLKAWLAEHLRICHDFRGCMRGAVETVIAGIIFYLDSTHLAQFGTKKAWPIYMFFAKEPKYSQNKPTKFSAQHMAYIPEVCSSYKVWLWNASIHSFTYRSLTGLPNGFTSNLGRCQGPLS